MPVWTREAITTAVADFWTSFIHDAVPSSGTALSVSINLLAESVQGRFSDRADAFRAALVAKINDDCPGYLPFAYFTVDYKPSIDLLAVCEAAGIPKDDVFGVFPFKTYTCYNHEKDELRVRLNGDVRVVAPTILHKKESR